MKTSVLLAISDPNVGIVLGEYLRLREFEADFRESASEAFNAAAKNRYDFCVLGLDDKEALLQLTTDIRCACDTPIFIVQTAFDKDEQIALYGAGADDCLVQPLFPDLLICKMQAMLKRWNEFQRRLPQVFDYPNVHFDSITQTLTISPSPNLGFNSPPKQGEPERVFHLSTKENSVLLLLCRNQNQLVERSRILKEVWLSDSYFNARSLSVYINHLRHYIEPYSTLRIISMRTRGYKLLIQS